MRLNKLSIKDRKIFDEFLNLSKQELSVYAFENIYIWGKFYDISWAIIKGSLCVFFRDKIGCFLYLQPLGEKKDGRAAAEAFKIMDSFNDNKDISRIENVEEAYIGLYRDLGYECRYKSTDYVCKRADLAYLKGDKFKSKRAGFNYFIKHYADSKVLPFSLEYSQDCLGLFELWSSQRKAKLDDKIYCGMIDDSKACLIFLFDNYLDLNITGRIACIGGQVKAFSFGFRLNQDTFCILYEITDLSIKGLAQFIFRKFSAELKDFRYINIMDASGLDNLKKVKLSYRPVKLIPAYSVKRKSVSLINQSVSSAG